MASTEDRGSTQRLAARLSDQSDRLMPCVHCGFCLPACPTYTRLGDEADSPRGRLHLMSAVVEGRLEAADEAFQTHIDRCLGCRACESVCPSGVEYGLLLEAARSVAVAARPPGRLTRLLLKVFGSDALSGLSLMLGRLLRATGVANLTMSAMPNLGPFRHAKLGLAMLVASGPSRHLPRSRGGSREVSGDGVGGDGGSGVAGEGSNTVALLDGCVQAGLFGRVNRATARTLRANGHRVVAGPEQGCCGALHAHTGDLEGAKRLAKRNIVAFERSGADHIVVNAAGCGAAMREYGHLFSDDPAWYERAAGVAAKVRDVSEILTAADLRRGAPLPLSVTYDAPCHLHHAQRITSAPVEILASIPALELVPLPSTEECCGGAGIYGITHPELGSRIGGDKVADVIATGAQLVASGNPGCMMQIGGGLRLRGAPVDVVHPVELLDASYEKAGFYSSGAHRAGKPAGSQVTTQSGTNA